jgi:DNA mismatch repair protein MutS2
VDEVEAGRRKGLAAEATERAFAEAPELPGAEPEAAGRLEVGARVRHRSLGWEGDLQSLDRGKAEVRVAGKRLRCSEEELVVVADEKGPKRGRPGPRPAGRGKGVDLDLAAGAEAPQELQLIGERVEPALRRLDDYLDRALLASRREVRIVHGHGSGQLRKAVREHLRGHPAVANHRPGKPEEGGDGATVVVLNGA